MTLLSDVVHGRHRTRLRLFAPLRYLAIWHPEKMKYDVVLPAGLGVVLWIAYELIFPSLELFGENGLMKSAREILMMVVPFLVGALATVATGFPGAHLDKRPPGAEIILDGRVLTLRQFVCYLLGYLCFIGLMTLLGVVAAAALRSSIATATENWPMAQAIVRGIGTFILFNLLSALLITVMWAIYFLTDIVNRPATVDDH